MRDTLPPALDPASPWTTFPLEHARHRAGRAAGLSGFFSIAETAMMAANRYRLKHRAQRGDARRQARARRCSPQTDKLLGVILLGNTLVAAAAATLTAVITKRLFGEGRARARARHASRSRSRSSCSRRSRRRSIGAAHADRIAPLGELRADADAARPRDPVVWFVNLFVQGLLSCCASGPSRRRRNAADAGRAALAGARRQPVFPRQAPDDAREPHGPRGDHASTT